MEDQGRYRALEARLEELESKLRRITSSGLDSTVGKKGNEIDYWVMRDPNLKGRRAKISVDLGASPQAIRIEEV